MARYLGRAPTVDRGRSCAPRCAGRRSPAERCRCCCGAAFKNKGVQPLLDAVVDYLPSPIDMPPVAGMDPDAEADDVAAAGDDEPFSALAFKIMNDPFVGQLTFFRVYSGKVESGATVYNAAKGKRERIGRLLRMHANKREDIKEVTCGNIAAAVGLRVTATGDTLCDEKAPVVLERDGFPAPVISIAIEPKTQADQDKLGDGAAEAGDRGSVVQRQDRRRRPGRRSSRAWASFTWRSSSTAWCASSRSRRTSAGRRSPTARPSRATAEAEGKYIRQTGGRGQYGHVQLQRGAGAGQGRSCSRTRPSAAQSRASSSRRSSGACASRWPGRAWPAIR